MSAEKKRSTRHKTRTLKVDALARVEGEGGMWVRVKDGKVAGVRLEIYEPPRFFEAFLRGRRFSEAVDITARICGICPVAYQMSACHAMEDACGVTVDGPLRELRRLLYCGEWIGSHVLHVFMLHAPDFLGYESAIHMSKDHPELVRRGLELKKVGNRIVTVLGGRAVHPINVRVGGFYRLPDRRQLAGLVEPLEWAREASVESLRQMARFEFPDFERDYDLVALRHPDEYPLNEGRLASSSGLEIPVHDYGGHFEELHVAHSNALHSRIVGGGSYFVGPLARYGLNFDRLSPLAQQAAREAGLGPVCRNPFRSLLVRMVEVVWACDEALRILAEVELPDRPRVEVEAREGVGFGCTEAPRGILFHGYRIDSQGLIQEAKIVPPTSQNQRMIEEDLGELVQQNLELPQERLTWQCEQAIRNYDPCISCATHFLNLHVEHE